jgi:serine/threonine protein kinase/Tfp pilus assembly protein PilF
MLECALQPEILTSAEGGAVLSVEAEVRASSPTKLSRSEEVALGSMIGRYELLEKIGEGGFGVVYVAEQREPVKRQVALKIIKLGMDTKQVIARFEAERQALALMDHPNIAKVLDGGATETGRPYFVMELVRGIKITEYCDQNNFSTRERLDLFIQVCQTIQHAHQKGIIHRDIKPSNILVTSHDGVPVPKVIDFGIAKATQGKLTDITLFTAFEQFMGTPAYMSPEQAELSALDIDTRSDIYSLGVLLYELLTGKTPFDARELIAAGLDALRQTIREKEPERPSTKLSTMLAGDLMTIAKQRQTEPLKLVSAVRGDLDWIVMKCLEKNRVRRYETANDLAADLHRHLNEEPVAACPPSNTYRLQKLVRRNKLAFAATTAVLVSLLAGLGVALWMYTREKVAKQTAQTEAQRSEQVAQFLKDTLQGVGPSVALGRDTTILREILESTSKRLHTELTNQPAIQSYLLSTIGGVYRALNDYTNAENYFREALTIKVALWGETNRSSASSMNDLGAVLVEQTKFSEAEPLLRKGLAIQIRLLGPEHPEIATSIQNLGVLLQYEGNCPEAEKWLRESLRMRIKLLGSNDLQVADSLTSLSFALGEEKSREEKEKLNLEALAIRKKHLGEVHPDIAQVWNNLGHVYQLEGKDAEAESAYRQCAEQWHKFLKDGSVGEAYALINLASLLSDVRGDFTNAEVLCRQSLEMRQKIFGAHAQHDDIAQSLDMLARILQRKGDLEQAEQFRQAHLDMTRALHGEQHPNVIFSKYNLALILHSERKFPEAASMMEQALSQDRKLLGGTNADVVLMLHDLGAIKADQCLLPDAEKLMREALEVSRAISGKDDGNVASSLMLLACILCQENKFAEAESPARQATEILRIEEPNSWLRYAAETVLGGSLARQTNYTDAEPLLVSGTKGLKAQLENIPADFRIYYREAIEDLVRLYEGRGDWEQAERFQQAHLDTNRALYGDDHTNVIFSKYNLALILHSERKFPEAASMMEQALSQDRKLLGGTNANVVQMLHDLGAIKAEQGLLPDAEKLIREALEVSRAISGKDDGNVAGPLMALACILCREHKFVEAESLARHAAEILRVEEPDSWLRYAVESVLGASLGGQTNYTDAEPFLVLGTKGLEAQFENIPVDSRIHYRTAIENLIGLYEVKGDAQASAEWREKLSKLAQGTEKRSDH